MTNDNGVFPPASGFMPAGGFTPARADYDAYLRERFYRRQGIMQDWGVKLAGLSPGGCELSLSLSPLHLQHMGFVNGGVLAAIADNVCGLAFASLLSAEQAPLTVEFKINFLAPAVGDSLAARAQVIRKGGTLGVVEGRLYGVKKTGEEKLAAITLQTLIAVPKPPDMD
jgi:uncharacterized protein (TIGR00369 family)